MRKLLRVEDAKALPLAAEIGGGGGLSGGGEEVVADDAYATRLDEILKRGLEFESLLRNVSDRDCIFFFLLFFPFRSSLLLRSEMR